MLPGDSSSSSSSEDASYKKYTIEEELNIDTPSVEIADNTQTTDECIIKIEESERDEVLDPIPGTGTKCQNQEVEYSNGCSKVPRRCMGPRTHGIGISVLRGYPLEVLCL